MKNYAFLVLLLALVTSAQCQQTADDWTAKGGALFEQGKHDEAMEAYDEAIEAYDEILKLDPTIGLAWAGKGEALRALGNTAEADVAFAKAKELGYKS